MFSEQDESWMQRALQLAQQAAANNEVPVGAVLVLNDTMIGEGSNCPIGHCDPSAHAEMIALREGAKKINNYRLPGSILYVTLEPCLMCIGALIHARVKRVIFGAFDPKVGGVETALSIESKFNHRIIYSGGLLTEQCGALLQDFFKKRRS